MISSAGGSNDFHGSGVSSQDLSSVSNSFGQLFSTVPHNAVVLWAVIFPSIHGGVAIFRPSGDEFSTVQCRQLRHQISSIHPDNNIIDGFLSPQLRPCPIHDVSHDLGGCEQIQHDPERLTTTWRDFPGNGCRV